MERIKYFTIIGLFLLLAGCTEENGSRLITSVTQMTFMPTGGSQMLQIESNTNWRIVSNVDWLSVYPMSGQMNQNVTISVAAKEYDLEQETTLVVVTDDGEKVVNVFVKVEGTSVKTGKYLDVLRDRLYIGGKSHSTTEVAITSNTTWEILGPEWIEAWDGDRWRSLSPIRGIVRGSGTRNVSIRAAHDNKEENSLMDIISVREYLTGEYLHTSSIIQPGRMEVNSQIFTTLENGVVFGWVCGCDVRNIYYKVTNDIQEKGADADNNTIRNSYTLTDESYLNSVDNLKAGAPYKIICIGEDNQGNMSNNFFSINGYTAPEKSPKVSFGVAEPAEPEGWKFMMQTTRDVVRYNFYATDNPNSAFKYNDPILMHIWWTTTTFRNDEMAYTTPGWVVWKNLSTNPSEIHALVMVEGMDEEIRFKPFRFDRCYDANGNKMPSKPLLDRIPKAIVNDSSLR